MKQSTSASRLTRLVLATLFSPKVCTAVTAILSTISFFLAVTGKNDVCVFTAMLMLPWFVKGLRHVGE